MLTNLRAGALALAAFLCAPAAAMAACPTAPTYTGLSGLDAASATKTMQSVVSAGSSQQLATPLIHGNDGTSTPKAVAVDANCNLDVDLQTALPAGTNTIGATVPIPRATANGMTSSRVVAAASTNAAFLKAAAGNIGRIDLFNTAAYDVFVKFYNKASAPTVGTDTPVWTVPLKAGSGYASDFMFGKSFATGIAYAITKFAADADTTATVAGDVTGSIDWL